jgi:hypothetical protein
MTSDNQGKETWIKRHGWKVMIAVSIIFGLFGIGDVLQGMNADPAIAESITGVEWEELQASSPRIANLIDLSVRSTGASIIFLSILSISITLTAFKEGKRWAWYALWIWPIWNLSIFILFFMADRHPDFPPPPPMLSAPIFFITTFLVLLLSYRQFFPSPDSNIQPFAVASRDA